MNPNAVFSASLITSLVLWFPSMQACLRGDLDLPPAGSRYLAALLVSRLAWGALARLVNGYRATQQGHTAPPVATDDPGSAGSRRRGDDRGGTGETDSGPLAA